MRRRVGFTLVELLVVIAIIGILVALLLPAVNAARAAARRSQCQNQIRQIGLALLNYESAQAEFPPASTWLGDAKPEDRNNLMLGPNWVIFLLPYIEETALHDQFSLEDPINADINAIPRSQPIALFLCPEDSFNRTPFNGSATLRASELGDNWARGNYAANGALKLQTYWNGGGAAFGDSVGWKDPLVRGVMGANISTKLRQIKDGTSKTVLVGELRAGLREFDSRGVWAMSGASPSSLWGHGYWGDDNGPNNFAAHADDIPDCVQVRQVLGGQESLARMRMGCSVIGEMNIQQTMRSLHEGGVFTCFIDGSVRFISDDIQLSTNMQCCSVWDRINLSADSQVLDTTEF